jgi:hypothetical protein
VSGPHCEPAEVKNATTETEEHEEIEVTQEMMEAGFRVLVKSGIVDDPLEADKLWLVEIYQAMAERCRR